VVVSGNYAYVADYEAGLLIFEITELPAITHAERTGNGLTVEWNDPAKGMTLQRTTSLTNPDWADLLGSEATNRVTLPIWSGNEFFRLRKP
jgi:Fe-S cluster assembly ATPase SufC